MKKIVNTGLSLLLACSLAGCASSGAASTTTEEETTSTASTEVAATDEEQTFVVGISQLVQHVALDAATQGFKDVLTETFGDRVTFDEQNASGDSSTSAQIANAFVSEGVDLILANATPSLLAAAAATNSIPILGTAVTDYGTALSLDDYDGLVGGNISGTSDLAPLDQQAALFDELIPDATNIGILYCSAEANSKYQSDQVQAALEDMGKTVTVYTFVDSNDIAAVVTQACAEVDALYIPTDNTAASCTETIDPIASAAGIPIIAGEEGIMSGCGIATLSIDYYELGRTTGEMAVKILNGESDISEMPIEYYQNPVKEYDADRCESLGITVPDDFTAYVAE